MTKLTKVRYSLSTDKCAIAARLGVERGIFQDEGLIGQPLAVDDMFVEQLLDTEPTQVKIANGCTGQF